MKSTKRKSKKVIVALSGGVDSAVAAALLKKRGYDIIAVYFRFNENLKAEFQAGKIAKKLNISLKIVDVRKEFKKRVIRYFLDSYIKGQTPNPCVVCNKEMKFRLLFDLMRKFGADFIATGHYAKTIKSQSNKDIEYRVKHKSQISKQKIIFKLLRGIDDQKDQSYFLYKLNQKELARIIFPLGDHKKDAVKKMAKKLKLPIAESESQDVCFVEGNDTARFLRKYTKFRPGFIKDAKGKTLGEHKGLPQYTIGQRKGIEIGNAGPYFVLRKDARKNELFVTNDPKDLLTKEFRVGQANWIDPKTKFPSRAGVQIRYHAEIFPAIIKKEKDGKYSVETKRPLRAVTPGQSAVFYRNEQVLGGGIII